MQPEVFRLDSWWPCCPESLEAVFSIVLSGESHTGRIFWGAAAVVMGNPMQVWTNFRPQVSEGRPSPSAFFYGSTLEILLRREHLPTSLPPQAEIRNGHLSSGPSPPMSLSSEPRDLIGDRKCSCLPEIRDWGSVTCFRQTPCLPSERSQLKKTLLKQTAWQGL